MTSYNKTGLLFAGLAIASAHQPLLAAEKTATEQQQELVVTGTRSAAPVLQMSGNIDSISEGEVDLLRVDHPSEILNRLSGVNITRNNGMESLPSIRSPQLTGPGAAGAFLFLEDGIGLRAAGFANNNGLAEANLEQAGGVEAVRGPGSAFYGSNAVHGVLNVLSRAPSLELEREIDLSVGPNDLYKIKGSISDTIGRHGYRISANGLSDGGYRADTSIGMQKLQARHDYFGLRDSFKTVLNVFNLNQETASYFNSRDNTANGGSCYTSAEQNKFIYQDVEASRVNCDPDAYRDWSSIRLSSRWDHEVNENQSFSITPYFRDNQMEFRQHFLPSRAIEENEHTSFGVQSGYTWELDGGHKVIAGIDAEYTSGSLKQTQQLPDRFSFGRARQQGVHYDFEVDATVFAPYIHTEWQVLERLRLVAGLRYEHTRYDYDNLIADGTTKADGSSCVNNPPAAPAGANEVECLYKRPADREDGFDNFSPKLGAVFQISDSNSIFANWRKGHRAPQVTDLYRIQNRQTTADIESERIDSKEIGLRGSQGELRYELVFFNMHKRNFFFRDTNGLNVTTGKTEHHGIEADVSVPVTAQFDIGATFTLAKHRYEAFANLTGAAAGNAVDSAPEHIGNVRFGWNFITGGRAELEWEHIGRYYLDPANIHEYDGHDLLHLRVSKPVHQNVTLHARIHNLTDEAYANRADFAFGNYRFFVGQERAVHLGATFSF